MPEYSFRHKESGETFRKNLSMAEREVFLKENPDIEQFIEIAATLNARAGANMKPPDVFRDIVKNIKKNHFGSTIKENW